MSGVTIRNFQQCMDLAGAWIFLLHHLPLIMSVLFFNAEFSCFQNNSSHQLLYDINGDLFSIIAPAKIPNWATIYSLDWISFGLIRLD